MARTSKIDPGVLRAQAKSGLNPVQLAELHSVNKSHIYRLLRENGISGPNIPLPRMTTGKKKASAKVVVPFTTPSSTEGPPRPAMYALAEFDEVIARALRKRLNAS